MPLKNDVISKWRKKGINRRVFRLRVSYAASLARIFLLSAIYSNFNNSLNKSYQYLTIILD